MPATSLTPGSRFLLKNGLPMLSVPLATYWISKRFSLPVILRVVASFGILPLWFCTKIAFQDIRERIAASRLGAQVLPKLRARKPGNLDIIESMMVLGREGYPGEGFGYITAAHGHTLDLWLIWDHLISTTEPMHVKQILVTEFNNFVKGPGFQEEMASVLGSGVFNSDGEMWKFHRAMTRPFFTKERISHFELFDRRTHGLISQMKDRLREGYAVNIQDAMYRFTLDSATEFLFGLSVDSISSGLPYPHNADPKLFRRLDTAPHATSADEFAEAFKQAQEIVADRDKLGWMWPLFEIFEDKTKKVMEIVNSFVEPIIKQAIEKRVRGEERDEEEQSLLENLVKETTDPVVLRDETINLMIAGRDTTAGALTFVFYFLSMYPAIFSRLRDEVLRRVGSSRMPTYDDVKEMKYLRAVINETLRLYPSVPFNVRTSINETTLPSADSARPYYVPPRTTVLYSVFHMHRRTDLWGPDAEEFDPDRFLATDPRFKFYLKNSFIFLPFNAGPRICLGQQFAYNEMSFMIIRILQNFSAMQLDLTSHPPDGRAPEAWATDELCKGTRKGMDKVWPKSHLTMYCQGGVWLKMKEAGSDPSQIETQVLV